MLVEIDPSDIETLKIAERLLSESEEGKKTIEEIKKKQRKEIQRPIVFSKE
jgi:hypothetical protein